MEKAYGVEELHVWHGVNVGAGGLLDSYRAEKMRGGNSATVCCRSHPCHGIRILPVSLGKSRPQQVISYLEERVYLTVFLSSFSSSRLYLFSTP